MIIMVYILAAYLEECGLNQYIANWFISRKIGEGRPWVFTLLIVAAAFFMSAFVSMYATIIILWMIFYKICDQIGEPPRTKYTAMVISVIVFICGVTGAIFPFKAFAVLIIGLTQQGIGQALDINFVTWTIYNVIICVVMIALFLLAYKFVLKPDLSRVKEAGAKNAHLRGQKMNRDQKVGALCMVALALVKKENGEPYINLTHLIAKGVNWELIILVSSTMPICNALEAEECGVLQSVIAWMTQTFSGFSGLTFLIVIAAIFLITTQVTHNLVLILVFTPVLTEMGLQFGVNPMVVMLVIFYTAMTAYATPAASSNAALIFGNEKWVDRKDAYLTGFLILLVAFIVVIGVAIPLGNVMF